jgi:hypothetical protein
MEGGQENHARKSRNNEERIVWFSLFFVGIYKGWKQLDKSYEKLYVSYLKAVT